MIIPETFVARMGALHGRAGEAWADGLPALLDRCATRFAVHLETSSFANLSWNLVVRARRRDGVSAVLKIGFSRDELVRERRALAEFAGRGAVRVLDADDEAGALLLERVEPGTPLSAIEDDRLATEIFSRVFRRLHGPPFADSSLHRGGSPELARAGAGFPSIEEHFAALARYSQRFVGGVGGGGPLPGRWVERAGDALAELVSSTGEGVLLHGDLHHGNILRRAGGLRTGNTLRQHDILRRDNTLRQHDSLQRVAQERAAEWAVIDPKGIVGDAHFDVIQYLLNYPARGGDPSVVLRSRIALLASRLGLDPSRIAQWGVARGVLEACWSLEHGGDWGEGIRIAERFAACPV